MNRHVSERPALKSRNCADDKMEIEAATIVKENDDVVRELGFAIAGSAGCPAKVAGEMAMFEDLGIVDVEVATAKVTFLSLIHI